MAASVIPGLGTLQGIGSGYVTLMQATGAAGYVGLEERDVSTFELLLAPINLLPIVPNSKLLVAVAGDATKAIAGPVVRTVGNSMGRVTGATRTGAKRAARAVNHRFKSTAVRLAKGTDPSSAARLADGTVLSDNAVLEAMKFLEKIAGHSDEAMEAMIRGGFKNGAAVDDLMIAMSRPGTRVYMEGLQEAFQNGHHLSSQVDEIAAYFRRAVKNKPVGRVVPIESELGKRLVKRMESLAGTRNSPEVTDRIAKSMGELLPKLTDETGEIAGDILDDADYLVRELAGGMPPGLEDFPGASIPEALLDGIKDPAQALKKTQALRVELSVIRGIYDGVIALPGASGAQIKAFSCAAIGRASKLRRQFDGFLDNGGVLQIVEAKSTGKAGMGYFTESLGDAASRRPGGGQLLGQYAFLKGAQDSPKWPFGALRPAQNRAEHVQYLVMPAHAYDEFLTESGIINGIRMTGAEIIELTQNPAFIQKYGTHHVVRGQ